MTRGAIPDKYRARSKHNKDACDFLSTKTPEYADWEVTALFYAVPHRINHYFEQHELPIPVSHGQRHELVKRRLPSVSKAYRGCCISQF